MKILIDGREYQVASEIQTLLLQQLQQFEINAYQGCDEGLRFLLMPLARYLLSWMEKKLAKSMSKEEAARIARPGKNPETGRALDPVLHFIALNMATSQAVLQNAEFSFETRDNAIIGASIQAPRAGRGSLAFDGHVGEREDDRVQVSGRGVHETIPNSPALYP